MKIYQRLKDLREERDCNQKTIAEEINVTQRTYSDYETGKTTIPLERLVILAKLYNVSLDYIIGVTNRKGRFPTK